MVRVFPLKKQCIFMNINILKLFSELSLFGNVKEYDILCSLI